MVQRYDFFLIQQSFLNIQFLILPLQPYLHAPLLAVVGVYLLVAGAEGVFVGVGGDAVFEADVPVGRDVVPQQEVETATLVLIKGAAVIVDEVALGGVQARLVVVHIEKGYACRYGEGHRRRGELHVLIEKKPPVGFGHIAVIVGIPHT